MQDYNVLDTGIQCTGYRNTMYGYRNTMYWIQLYNILDVQEYNILDSGI